MLDFERHGMVNYMDFVRSVVFDERANAWDVRKKNSRVIGAHQLEKE
jgi:hypothetical protein